MGVFLSFLVLFFHFAGSKMADFSHTGLLLFGKHCPLTFLLFWACFFFFSIWANIRWASVVVLWLKQKTKESDF